MIYTPNVVFFQGWGAFRCIIRLTMYFENVSNYRLRVPFIELTKGSRVRKQPY